MSALTINSTPMRARVTAPAIAGRSMGARAGLPAVQGLRFGPVRASTRRAAMITVVRASSSAAAPAPASGQNPMLQLALAAVSASRAVAGKVGKAIAPVLNEPLPQDKADSINAAIRKNAKAARVMLCVAPFAVISSGPSTLAVATQAIGSFIKMYLLLLFLRVLLTWFPSFDWQRQPWITLRQVTDPYLNLFRGIIPPIMGQIDFTPILGFLILQWLAQVLTHGADGESTSDDGWNDDINFF
mmetsp:Transcript_20258/g.64452  ORF Transcript_20258/g.64452 Transcript_20258/m.64452 type:complete len:243 (-) Transcript_20258:68-796(-)